MTETLDIVVTFSLPDWFAAERFQTVDGFDSDALFVAFPDQVESSVDPQGKWVSFRFPVDALPYLGAAIDRRRLKLDAFLGRLLKRGAR